MGLTRQRDGLLTDSMRRDFRLSADERRDARMALSVLEDSNLTLTQAAHLAVERKGLVGERVLVADAFRRFMDACTDRRLRERTLDDYRNRLGRFAEGNENAWLDEINRTDLREWLTSLNVSATSKHNFFRVLRAAFRWAARQEPPLISEDPTVGLQLDLPRREREIDFLSWQEAAAVMDGAGKYKAFFALNFFAGLRPSEIRTTTKPPLRWSQVDLDSRLIRIPATIAKTRRARVLENLPENLWAWLRELQQPPGEPVSPGAERDAVLHVKHLIGRPWPHDGGRHAFATHHVALTSDAAATSLLLGHEGSPTLLHRHYRGLTTQAEAKRFFALVP